MTDIKTSAQDLASKGRFGDDILVHMSRAELQGIMSLANHEKVSINPETGLPEAFWFLPFLASLFGGAAAPAAAALGTAATAAPALAAGTAAAGTAATAAAPSLLGTIGTGITTGIKSLFGGLGAGAGAAPAVDAMTTGAIGTGAGTAGGAIPTATLAPAALQNLPATTGAIPTLKSSFALAARPENVGAVVPKAMQVASTAADPWAGLRTVTAPIAQTGEEAGKGGLAGLFSMKNIMPMAMGLQALQAVGGMFKKDKKGKKRDISGEKYSGGDPVFPGRSYRGGIDNEWNYFPKYAKGGSVSRDKLVRRPNFTDVPYDVIDFFKNYGSKSEDYDYVIPPPSGGFTSRPEGDEARRLREYIFKGYANGGIVSLAQGGPVDPQMQMPQDMTFPQNGVPADAPIAEIPQSPMPSSQIGEEFGGPAPGGEGDKELIAQAVAAIEGKIPNPEPILMAFIQTFGEEAFQDLVTRVQGLKSKGQSDGTSDSVPAMIDGQQPAALSEGEYVVPADVVSGLGNGSTDAGAGQLDQLVAGTRTARTGSPEQPPDVGYSRGGIVSLRR